jgi:hypothetical protein
MYNFKDDIAVPSHNYSTRLKSKSNVIVPKIRSLWAITSLYNFVVIMI